MKSRPWRLLLFCFLIVGAGMAVPLERASADVLAAIGEGVAIESATDGRSYEIRDPFSLRAGYRFQMADVYLEYKMFQATDDGTQISDVTRLHQEWIAWARRMFAPKWIVSPYAAAGLGVEYDVIQSGFSDDSSRDVGQAQGLLATAVGLRATISENVELMLESRLGFSSGYSPNPEFGADLLLGVHF